MKIADLRASVQQRTGHPYDTYFTRRCSVFLTRALAPLGVTANQVSVVGLVVGLASCAMIAFGDGWMLIAGVLLVHLYAVLDSVDGELARLRRDFSLKGLFLEDLSAYYSIAAFPLAVGLAVIRHGSSEIPLILSIAYAAFGRNALPVARRAVLKSIQTQRPAGSPTAHGPATTSAIRRLVDGHVLNHTNLRAALSTTLVIETLSARAPSVTAGLLALVIIGLLLREIAALAHLLKGRNLDAMLWQIYRDAAAPAANDPAAVDPIRLARY